MKRARPKADDPVAKEQERIAKEAMGPVFADLERDTDEQLNAHSRFSPADPAHADRAEGGRSIGISSRPSSIDALALGPEQLELIQEILGDIKTEQDAYKESQKQANELAKASGDLDLEKMRKDAEKTQTRSYCVQVEQTGHAPDRPGFDTPPARDLQPDAGRVI